MSLTASRCTLIIRAPIEATCSIHFHGSTTIRWASIGRLASLAIASITGKPNDMFGTNVPSMMSRWKMSPLRLTTSTHLSRCRKSAASIEGAISGISNGN